MSWCSTPPCPTTCAPVYQPLPISTGNVGIDRCGNIEVYAAPATVQRTVCWPTGSWPIPSPLLWPYCGGGGLAGFAAVLTAGAPMAEWMINARRQGGLP